MAAGRPSKYSEELVNEICRRISTGSDGLNKICEEKDMPSTVTVYGWLNNPKYIEFLNKYVRAREEQADLLADEIIQIADETSKDTLLIKQHGVLTEVENKEWINRSRLRVDARKWKASKLAPKKYGDKVDITSAGQPVKTYVIELSEVTTKAE